MGLNYSWRQRERSCKSLHLHFSAPGCAALCCTPSDGVSLGKKAQEYPSTISIAYVRTGQVEAGLCANGIHPLAFSSGFHNRPHIFGVLVIRM